MFIHASLMLSLFGTQIVSATLKFNLTTEAQQCEPFTIGFSGSGDLTPLPPATLSILPFNSTAIFVPIPNPELSPGIDLSFLPIPAGSDFVTSIDDGSGENLIKVSDILRVLPSPTGNSSCTPSPSPRKFSLNATTVSQCEEMVIRYNASAVARSPTVRLYNPTGSSTELNQTSDDPVKGIAKYLVSFSRGKSVMFLLDDGVDVHETTPLLTSKSSYSVHVVSSISSSSRGCFQSHELY